VFVVARMGGRTSASVRMRVDAMFGPATLTGVGGQGPAGLAEYFHEDESLELFERKGFDIVPRGLWQTKDGDESVFAFRECAA